MPITSVHVSFPYSKIVWLCVLKKLTYSLISLRNTFWQVPSAKCEVILAHLFSFLQVWTANLICAFKPIQIKEEQMDPNRKQQIIVSWSFKKLFNLNKGTSADINRIFFQYLLIIWNYIWTTCKATYWSYWGGD